MPQRNNHIVVDLNKVQYAKFYYINQYGNIRYTMPAFSTVRNEIVNDEIMAAFHPEHPGETIHARAKRLNLVDVWGVQLVMKLQANSSLIFTGEKAKSLWKAWKAKHYGK